MVTFAQISEKLTEMARLIQDWGYQNPQLFKSIVELERGHLNILVDPVDDSMNSHTKRLLERDLESILNCFVVVTARDQLASKYEQQITREAIPLSEKDALLAYYGGEAIFDPSDGKMQSPDENSIRTLIRTHLVQSRKRGREDHSSEETPTIIEVKKAKKNSSTEEIEKNKSSLSLNGIKTA